MSPTNNESRDVVGKLPRRGSLKELYFERKLMYGPNMEIATPILEETDMAWQKVEKVQIKRRANRACFN